MTTDPQLPAPAEAPEAQRPEGPPATQQNLSVALLPLALISFLVLSFIAIGWTFIAAP